MVVDIDLSFPGSAERAEPARAARQGRGGQRDRGQLHARASRGGRAPELRIAFHVTMRLVDERVIAPSRAARRIAARVMLQCGKRRGLLAFRVADTHLHALLACSRAEAGAFARAVEAALRIRLRLPVPFEAARVRPVTDQRHLVNAFHYIHRQEERHGIVADPLHDGSSLPDLLGMRVVGAFLGEVVVAHLPRLRSEELLSHLGEVDLASAAIDLTDLADAAGAALALPDLAGHSRAHRRAQSAAVCLAKRSGMPRKEVARLIGVSYSTVQRLEDSPAHNDAEARALELQLRLRTALRAQSGASAT